jgi:hypothetical protein
MLKIAEVLNVVRSDLLIVRKERRIDSLPISQNMIDIPGSLDNCNVNCCHTDVSLSVRLFIL